MKTNAWTLMFLAGAVALTACSDHEHETESDPPPPPELSISVDPSIVEAGGTITITVDVTHFKLLDPSTAGEPHNETMSEGHGTASGATEGHYHIYLDTFDENPVLMAWEQVQPVTIDAEPGEHDVMVRLNDNSHRIIEPQVWDSAKITVEAVATP